MFRLSWAPRTFRDAIVWMVSVDNRRRRRSMNRGHNRRLSETRVNVLDVRCLFGREIGVRASTA